MNIYRNKHALAASSGFTLIELIVVIVILGVLAVTAAPKFVDISTDARISTLKTVESSLESSAKNFRVICNLYEACRTLPSWPNKDVYVPAYGQNIHMIGGFPEAGTLSRVGEIHDFIESTGLDVTTPDGKHTRWSISDTTDCYVQYKQIDGAETFPLIELVSSGC